MLWARVKDCGQLQAHDDEGPTFLTILRGQSNGLG